MTIKRFIVQVSLSLPALLLMWVLANGALWLLCRDVYQQNQWRYFLKHDPTVVLMAYRLTGAAVVAIILLEFSLLTVALHFFRALQAGRGILVRTICALCSVLISACFAIYFSLIPISWYYFNRTTTFISSEELRAIAFLGDFSFLRSVVTVRELVVVIAALSVSTIFVTLVYRAVNLQRLGWQSVVANAVMAMIMAGFIVFCSFAFSRAVDEEHYKWLAASARSYFMPQLSLGWADILFDHEIDDHIVAETLELEPASAIGQYLERIKSAPRPEISNVIIIFVEAMRFDTVLRGGGDKEIAPHINAIIDEGRLWRGYAPAPETSETILSVLTGLYPLRSMERDIAREWNFPHRFLFSLLAPLEFQTAFIGETWEMDKTVMGNKDMSLLFDPQNADYSNIPDELNPWKFSTDYFGSFSPAVSDKLKTKVLIDFLEKNRTAGKPTFAVTYYMSSHFPYEQSSDIEQRFTPTEIKGDESFLYYPKSSVKAMKNRYFNTIRFIDSLIGQIIEYLRSTKQMGSTLLVITGDHGQLFHEHDQVTHGGYLHEEVISVPLIIWGGDKSYQSAKVAPVSLVRLAPTILNAMGLPPFPGFQGDSFFELGGENTTNANLRPIFSSVQMFAHEDAIIDWPWKFVKNYRGMGGRLYNLVSDPIEVENQVAARPHEQVRLESCLRRFRNAQLYYYGKGSPYNPDFLPPPLPTSCIDITH